MNRKRLIQPLDIKTIGWCLSNAVFQNLVNDILRDILNYNIFVYLNNILIYSSDLNSHVSAVREVLQILLSHKFYVKAEKSEFHKNSISFLGYVISEGQVKIDQRKVQAVINWPAPSLHKNVEHVLGDLLISIESSFKILVLLLPLSMFSHSLLVSSRWGGFPTAIEEFCFHSSLTEQTNQFIVEMNE